MKYFVHLDNRKRYQLIEINSFELPIEARINLTFPAPNYFYYLSDKEINKFSTELYQEWQELMSNKVKKLFEEIKK